MSVDCFLDSNVLVYAASADPRDAARKTRALELIADSDFGLSAQVLQEFYVAVTRKLRPPLPPEQATELVAGYRVFPVVWTDFPLIISAIENSLRYGISYWGGAIVAAAAVLRAPILYTEDLNDGQVYAGVRVVNPFVREE